MAYTCRTCSRSESEAIADAKALGLEQELAGGRYTCCQIAQWADEQALAWFEATRDDGASHGVLTELVELDDTEMMLVRVRVRRPQVPWFRNPDDCR
jgi:hypothetical protein